MSYPRLKMMRNVAAGKEPANDREKELADWYRTDPKEFLKRLHNLEDKISAENKRKEDKKREKKQAEVAERIAAKTKKIPDEGYNRLREALQRCEFAGDDE